MTGYLRQLQRSIDFIETHLGEEMRTVRIAKHAGGCSVLLSVSR